MNIIIIGYGRVGASLASLLSDGNDSVVVIDNDPAVVAGVDPDFPGRVIVGLGYDENVLIEAGVEECDALAAVTSSDNVNLMTSEVARRLFDVPYVITRLVNPARLDVYEQLGLDYVCDTEIVAEDISAKIRSRHSHHLDTFGPYEVLTFSLLPHGEMRVSDVEALGSVDVILVRHGGMVVRPSKGMALSEGDTIMAAVRTDSLVAVQPYMKG